MTIKVDLLPSEKRGFRLDPMVIILVCLIALCWLGFSFYGQNLTARIDVANKKVDAVKAEIKENEKMKGEIAKRKQELARLDQQILIVKTLVHDPLRYAHLLQEIGSMLPPNVWLNTLSIEPGTQTINFAGTATETAGRLPLATIAQLMKNFAEGSPYFRDPTLASTSQTKVNNVLGFTFSLTIKYDPQKAADLPPGSGNAGNTTAAPNGATPGAPATPAPPAAVATPAPSSTPGAPGAASPTPSATPGK
jgi:Tfp pilus assembly protein PilN